MEIKRVLNNNTIIALDKNQEEIVVKGKGIGFGKQVGEAVDQARIEKVFVLDTKETLHQYQEVIQDISEDIIETAEVIIEDLKQHTDKQINDKIYITLTDHISNLLERISLGIKFDSSLLWNVQALYPEEYQLAQRAVTIMRERFDVKIPADEANFIAIHIVNLEMDVAFQDTVGITKTIDEIVSLIKKDFPNVQFVEQSLDFSRFVLHLRFLLQRILQEGVLDYQGSEEMVALLIQNYPVQAKCVTAIMRIITEKYQREIEGERLFLLIHVIRLTTANEPGEKCQLKIQGGNV